MADVPTDVTACVAAWTILRSATPNLAVGEIVWVLTEASDLPGTAAFSTR